MKKIILLGHAVLLVWLTYGSENHMVHAQQTTQGVNWSTRASQLHDKYNYNRSFIVQSMNELYARYDAILQADALDVQASNAPLQFDLSNGGTAILVYIDQNNRPVYRATSNSGYNQPSYFGFNQVRDTNAEELHGLSILGEGQLIGLWDGGRIFDHYELEGRFTYVDDTGLEQPHSMGQAGIMIARGFNLNALGMAPDATIRAYDFDQLETEMITEAINEEVELSNHSFGDFLGWELIEGTFWYWYGDISVDANEDYKFGFYTRDSQFYDELMRDNSYWLIVTAAGNHRLNDFPVGEQDYKYFDGNGNEISVGMPPVNDPCVEFQNDFDCPEPDGDFDTLAPQAVSKNALTVGALSTDNITVYENSVAGRATSFGPTDDGRIKPDIMAQSENVTLLENDNGASGYITGFNSETSGATSAVTGAVALLRDAMDAPLWASTYKGLIIHTAYDLSNAGPDYQTGWGRIDVKKAYDVIEAEKNTLGPMHIYEVTLRNNDGIEFDVDVSSSSQPLRVTMAWTDVAAEPLMPALDPPDKMLINDLDLKVTNVADGSTYLPYILDPANPASAATTGDNTRDNVEQVFIDFPNTGTYTVSISHKGFLAAGEQAISLIITGNGASDGFDDPPVGISCSNPAPSNKIRVGGVDANLGASVALDGDWGVIGTPGEIDFDGTSSPDQTGAVKLMHWNGQNWTIGAGIRGDQHEAWLGYDVGIGAESVVAGTPFFDLNEEDAGEAQYYYTPGYLQLDPALSVGTSEKNGLAGYSVGVDGDVTIVGIPGKNNGEGQAKILRRSGNALWSTEAVLEPQETFPVNKFGAAVDIDGDVAVAVGYSEPLGVPFVNEQLLLVNLYRWNGTSWTDGPSWTVPVSLNVTEPVFSAAISGNHILVGSKSADANDKEDVGKVYAFKYWWDGTDWVSSTSEIDAPDPQVNGGFGYSVALEGGSAIIGAPGMNKAYFYRLDGDTWVHEEDTTPTDACSGDSFGRSVAISQNHVWVGAPFDDVEYINAGSVYAYTYAPSSLQLDAERIVAEIQRTPLHYSAAGLVAANDFLVGANTDVIFTSASSIKLEAGFKTEPGAAFKAVIDPGLSSGVTGQSGTLGPSTAPSAAIAVDQGSPLREPTAVSTSSDQPGKPEASSQPVSFDLSANYPNPFNPSTTIEYAVLEAARVTLKVYNLLGEEVAVLVDQQQAAGTYTISWSALDSAGNQLPSGTYLYRLTAGGQQQVKSMMFVK
ncbi:MAG: S8 family serine peptidase [Rhodothermaceae bacterium]|nr:S8 family serine peptidase [Rhodothermaceae bacterium]